MRVTRQIRVTAMLAFLQGFLYPFASLAREDMSGVWKEEYTEEVYSVEQWGSQCGEAPRSRGRRSRGLKYTVEDRGVDLLFTGKKGNKFSTAGCQSKNKQVKPKERTLKDKLFLINCATAETTQSYESGLYSFRIKSPKRIEYRETTRFSRNVGGSLCVHTLRVRRVYLRVGDIPTEKAADKAPAEKDGGPLEGKKIDEKKEDPCESPGLATRLVLEPTRVSLGVGEEFCPRTKAFDERGCATAADLSWGKGIPPRGIQLTTAGCLKVTRRAKAGLHKINLKAGKTQATVTIEVRRRVAGRRPAHHDKPVIESSEDAGFSQVDDVPEKETVAATDVGPSVEPSVDAGPGDAQPAPADTATAVATSDEVKPKAGSTSSPTQKMAAWVLPAAVGGGCVLLVSLLAVFFLRRRAKAPTEDPGAEPLPTTGSQPTVPEPLRPAAQAEGEYRAEEQEKIEEEATTSADKPAQIFCTTCGKAIPAEAKFCPYDRTPVYRPSSPTLASAPICPKCKRLLPAGAKFCPYDQTKIE